MVTTEDGKTGRERREDKIGISVIECSEIGLNKELTKNRQLQDSNLRGQSPTDFESVSLTTRTSCLGLTLPNTLLQSLTPSFKLEFPIIVSSIPSICRKKRRSSSHVLKETTARKRFWESWPMTWIHHPILTLRRWCKWWQSRCALLCHVDK